jgi:hypothetical protein
MELYLHSPNTPPWLDAQLLYHAMKMGGWEVEVWLHKHILNLGIGWR